MAALGLLWSGTLLQLPCGHGWRVGLRSSIRARQCATCKPFCCGLTQPHSCPLPCCSRQLRHPNVVGFAGVTFHGSSRGVVLMELCEGVPATYMPTSPHQLF